LNAIISSCLSEATPTIATRLGLQNWFKDEGVKFLGIFDLLKEYIETGRVKLDKTRHPQLTTYHDPCNYARKSERAFGHGYYEEPRWITQQCVENFVDMYPNRANNFCCGAGGGAWAMPYAEERIYYGRSRRNRSRRRAPNSSSLRATTAVTDHEELRKESA